MEAQITQVQQQQSRMTKDQINSEPTESNQCTVLKGLKKTSK